MKSFAIFLAFTAALSLAPVIAAKAQDAPAKVDLSAFVGRWQVDPSQTHMNRNGPGKENILRSNTFSFAFKPDGEGLDMEVYASYPQPAPSHAMSLIADGKTRTCQSKGGCMTSSGDPSEQTFSFYELSDHVLARLFSLKGVMYDYSTMSVSTDGKTLTLISWAPETPQWQNIQVFEKQP